MLLSLTIKNFAIVRDLDVQWHSQMTTITGETGAGKSIAIDALNQALGERSDVAMVREGADKAQITAAFDIRTMDHAQKWLASHDLAEDNECILRRVVYKEGRSQGYINGNKVPAAQLRELGNMLVSIHGQHAHQLLTKNEHQRLLVDQYGGLTAIAREVKLSYQAWKQAKQEFEQLKQRNDEHSAQRQLLEYQVEELRNADLQAGEFEAIEQEHKRLHNAQSLLQDSQCALDMLYESDNGNCYSVLKSAISQLSKASSLDAQLNSTMELLDGALIQLEEGIAELRHYGEQVELNPERLVEVEARLKLLMDLSRKHQVNPDQLVEHQAQLESELEQLGDLDQRLIEIEQAIVTYQTAYFEQAQHLSKARQIVSSELSMLITESLSELNMAGSQFNIAVVQDAALMSPTGTDKVEFLVCANQGQSMQPLAKVASGGELSRISLAIQVILAQKVTTPTLLFDEVDVGVSGPTATAVGKLMKRLSSNTQVICVTHLPQVASFGHQQQFVSKAVIDGETVTHMTKLDEGGRVDELARLLGGEVISATSRANAEELLAIANAH